MPIETKDIETISLEERDPIVHPVDLRVVSCTSQGGRVLLNCVDAFVATQCEGDGVPSDSRETIEHDELIAGLGCCNVGSYLAAWCQKLQLLQDSTYFAMHSCVTSNQESSVVHIPCWYLVNKLKRCFQYLHRHISLASHDGRLKQVVTYGWRSYGTSSLMVYMCTPSCVGSMTNCFDDGLTWSTCSSSCS